MLKVRVLRSSFKFQGNFEDSNRGLEEGKQALAKALEGAKNHKN
jgi:hypothetical protein